MSVTTPTSPLGRTAAGALAGGRRLATPVVVALAAGWLALGAVGVYEYVHRYWLYRGFPPPVTPVGIPQGQVKTVSFFSHALDQVRHYMVYLPPGWRQGERAGRRYPALYLLHAPPGRPSLYFEAGAITVRENVMIAHHEARPMIFVVPFGKTPKFGSDTEWANARAGRYEDFVIDVVRNVDHRFPAARGRRYRGIAGLSEGGYGAINIALHHLNLFSVAQSWSGYFVQTPTAAFTGATPAQLWANSPVDYVGTLTPRIRRLGLRVFLYQGTNDHIDPRQIRRFAHELRQDGALVHYAFYPGGHDWGLWRPQMGHMIRLASTWFARSPRAYHESGPLLLGGHPGAWWAQRQRLRRLEATCRRAPTLAAELRACGGARSIRRDLAAQRRRVLLRRRARRLRRLAAIALEGGRT